MREVSTLSDRYPAGMVRRPHSSREPPLSLAVLESRSNGTVSEARRPTRDASPLGLSQLTTFQSCPLRWHFEYVERLPPEAVPASLLFGSAMHAAIEACHQATAAGDHAPDLDELGHCFDQAWEEGATAPVRFSETDTHDTLRERARGLLAVFQDSDWVRPSGKIVGIARSEAGPVTAGLPPIQARIDLLVGTDSALVVRDYRTSRARWTAARLDEVSAQLLVLSELVRPVAESMSLPIRLECVVLVRTKAPAIESHEIQPDRHRRWRLQHVLGHVFGAMQTSHVYPNPSPLNCSTCPYTKACQDWQG